VYTRTALPSPRCDFMIQDAPSLLNKILPHFEEYPLQNLKRLDFEDFKTAMNLVRTKQHLNPEGLARIKVLAAGINTGRI
jgi:LAGLIDADG endonuclease